MLSDLLRLTECSWWVFSGLCSAASAAGGRVSGWRIESDLLRVMDLSRSNIDGVRAGRSRLGPRPGSGLEE